MRLHAELCAFAYNITSSINQNELNHKIIFQLVEGNESILSTWRLSRFFAFIDFLCTNRVHALATLSVPQDK